MRYLKFWLCIYVLLLGGCSSWNPWNRRSQSPDDAPVGGAKVKLVGDLAGPYGMYPVKVEAIGLVVGLQGTGSDPGPSPQRAILLEDMQRRGVEKPSQLLASKNTAMVVVRGFLRPGIEKGDTFDIEVRVPSHSDTTSLRGGWLMETHLKEMAVRDGQVFDGQTLGIAEGAILIDPPSGGKQDKVLAARGRILSGGRSLKTRSLGLALKTDHQNVANSARIARAVNSRFFNALPGGVQEGVAKAKTDKYVELKVHPRYKDNVARYMSVVRSVAMEESSLRRQERLKILESQLCDPITSMHAALQLEAVGREGIEVLKKGIATRDAEVKFRAAESLAYLDDDSAAAVLGEIARDQPAFRVFALTALSTMDGFSAHDQLSQLLQAPSAETRYGAFRSLWAKNPLDATIRGEELGGQFSFHVLAGGEQPMIHVTRSRRPEIVLFGAGQQLKAPFSLEAGPHIMVNSLDDQQIAISKFVPGQADQKRIVSMNVEEVIRAVVELGGTYPDVVQMLQRAKTLKSLPSRFEVDALPQAGRRYDRIAGGNTETGEDAANSLESDGSLPQDESITGHEGDQSTPMAVDADGDGVFQDETASQEPDKPKKSFFAKMIGSE